MSDKRKKKLILGPILLLCFLVVLQFAYYGMIFFDLRTTLSKDFDLVITYSDTASMEPALDLAHSHHKPLYVSQAPPEKLPFSNHPRNDLKEVIVDNTAWTTDQNARRATEFIRKGGYKRVVLDVAWFHLPRALFLTRLYLLGSGAEITPCSKTPLPDHWWNYWLFHREIFKFWGSLGRVALASIGIETGPKGP